MLQDPTHGRKYEIRVGDVAVELSTKIVDEFVPRTCKLALRVGDDALHLDFPTFRRAPHILFELGTVVRREVGWATLHDLDLPALQPEPAVPDPSPG